MTYIRDIHANLYSAKIVENESEAPRPFQGRFVICRLGLAMFKPLITLEISTITCNEEMKDNAKCKNSSFDPPFGDIFS